MAYFRAHPDSGVTRPDQIAIVGDRLSTDIMMANMMGGYGLWIRDGVQGRGFVSASARREHRGEWLHRIACETFEANEITVCES
jgi:ribonucleotide monophosphatase NagD (HAD superfamily)